MIPLPEVTKKKNELHKRFYALQAKRDQLGKDLGSTCDQLEELRRFLGIADRVTDALEVLSEQLFQRLLGVIQEKLSIALQEVLEQPIELKSVVDWKRKSIAVDFHIERNGNPEDILKGQGGSVANILSVGLRIFALTTLNEKEHRRVLILDEQDCWLRPELVTRLVKIIRDAGSELGFQVIMISHHDISAFENYADKVYRLIPDGQSVDCREIDSDHE